MSLRPSSSLIDTPIMEKIVHTAKQTVNANVLKPSARYWSPRVTPSSTCMMFPRQNLVVANNNQRETLTEKRPPCKLAELKISGKSREADSLEPSCARGPEMAPLPRSHRNLSGGLGALPAAGIGFPTVNVRGKSHDL